MSEQLTYAEVAERVLGDLCTPESIDKLGPYMLNCLQDAYASLRDHPHYKQKVDFELKEGQDTYKLADIGVERFTMMLGNNCCDLKPCPEHELVQCRCDARDGVKGEPTKWERCGDEIIVYPCPDKDYTYTVWGHRALDCVTWTDTVVNGETVRDFNNVDLPGEFQSAFWKHVRGMWELELGNADRAQNWLAVSGAEFATIEEARDDDAFVDETCEIIRRGGHRDCGGCGACKPEEECIEHPQVKPTDECVISNAAYRRTNAYLRRSQC